MRSKEQQKHGHVPRFLSLLYAPYRQHSFLRPQLGQHILDLHQHTTSSDLQNITLLGLESTRGVSVQGSGLDSILKEQRDAIIALRDSAYTIQTRRHHVLLAQLVLAFGVHVSSRPGILIGGLQS